MPSQWVEHLKSYSREHNIGYGQAMKNEDCKREWAKKKLKKQRADCRDLLQSAPGRPRRRGR